MGCKEPPILTICPGWATSALPAEGHDGPIPLPFHEMEFPQQLVSKFDHQDDKNIL